MKKKAYGIKDRRDQQSELKFLTTLECAFLITMLSTFILSLFKKVDLTYHSDFVAHGVVSGMLNLALFEINLYFLVAHILPSPDDAGWKITVWYIPVYIIAATFDYCVPILPAEIYTSIIPLVYIFFAFHKYKKGNSTKLMACRAIYIFLLMVVAGYLTRYIKFSFFDVGYIPVTLLERIVYQSDMFLIYFISLKVVKKHARLGLAFSFLPSQKGSIQGISEHGQKDLDPIDQEIAALTTKQSFIYWAMVMGYQFIQLAVVLLIGVFESTLIQIVMMLSFFWIGRSILKTSWHSRKLSICSAITFIGFWLLSAAAPPLAVSLFGTVALSAVFTYSLYIAALYEDDYMDLQSFKESFPKFSGNKMDKKDIIRLSQLAGYNERDIGIAVDLFCTEKLHKEIGDKYSLEPETIRRYKVRYKKDFEKISENL